GIPVRSPVGVTAANHRRGVGSLLRSRPMERRRVSSGSPFEPRVGFSRALRVGQRVLVSGTAPVWPDGSCDPDPASQARRCFAIILAALAELGGRPADVVRTRTYLVDRNDWESIGRVHGEIFGEIRPASTMVVVAGLLDPRWRVEIEAEAILDDAADPPDDTGSGSAT
ncbi:MAG TPA: RidA family protein, partial [Propionibacteriaceae bacterium]